MTLRLLQRICRNAIGFAATSTDNATPPREALQTSADCPNVRSPCSAPRGCVATSNYSSQSLSTLRHIFLSRRKVDRRVASSVHDATPLLRMPQGRILCRKRDGFCARFISGAATSTNVATMSLDDGRSRKATRRRSRRRRNVGLLGAMGRTRAGAGGVCRKVDRTPPGPLCGDATPLPPEHRLRTCRNSKGRRL